MKVEDILEIIIPTFNREKVLTKTLQTLLSSPVGKCQITILDNNSTDGTGAYIQSLLEKFPNIKYIKNRYNLGLAGNFCKGMMIPTKKYFWMVSDDTGLDFTCWDSILLALQKNYDVCLTLNYYDVKSCNTTTDKAHIILMLIWMFSGIFKTSLITDDVILMALTDIYTVHPQLALITKAVLGNNVYIPAHAITEPRRNVETEKGKKYTFNRNEKFFHFRLDAPMNFFPGFLNAVESIKDPKLKKECINLIFKYKFIKFSRAHFKHNFYHRVNFWDTFLLLPFKYKVCFVCGAIRYYLSFGVKREQ